MFIINNFPSKVYTCNKKTAEYIEERFKIPILSINTYGYCFYDTPLLQDALKSINWAVKLWLMI